MKLGKLERNLKKQEKKLGKPEWKKRKNEIKETTLAMVKCDAGKETECGCKM